MLFRQKIFPNTILNLHEISNKNYLKNIVESLKRHYKVIPIKELENFYYGNIDLKHSCHITFDDGHISFYKEVLPLIKQYNIPVSIYVSPLALKERKNFWFQELDNYDPGILFKVIKKIFGNKLVETQMKSIILFLKTQKIEMIWEIIRLYQKETNTPPKPYMNITIDHLKEIKSSGLVAIGAHTLSHPILKNESDDFAYKEVTQSIDDLSDILNYEVKYFAFPNGKYDVDFGRREINILKQKHIKLAFSMEKEKISHLNNPLNIPRSGSPLVLQDNYKQLFKVPLALSQLILGEKRYYQLVNTWKHSIKTDR